MSVKSTITEKIM